MQEFVLVRTIDTHAMAASAGYGGASDQISGSIAGRYAGTVQTTGSHEVDVDNVVPFANAWVIVAT